MISFLWLCCLYASLAEESATLAPTLSPGCVTGVRFDNVAVGCVFDTRAVCRWAINTAKLVTWSSQSYFRMAFLAIQVVTYAYK